MDGNIFDIQRFSIFDGPGIRTNVFFKGCNLRCLWCHNPESQKSKNQLMFFKNKCTGCGECAKICDKTFTADCIACGKCVSACKSSAREISGKTMSANDVIDAVMRDKEFYKTSGGGVTLSGGEPLLQIDFAVEILKGCKEHGIHTAVETAGNVPWDYFEKILPYLDLVLFDLKAIDEETHKKLVGVSNKQILSNAEKLKAYDVEVLFRMPVIPTLNDSEAEKVAEFAGDTPLEILAYHKTGNNKYDSLGEEYTLSHIEPPSKEFMESLAEKIGAEYSFTGI